jgi:hypothetical protein
MIDLGSQIPDSVEIDGVEYPYTKKQDLSEAEQIEVLGLTLRSVALLPKVDTGELSVEEAAELELSLERLVDLFLSSAPEEVRERLSFKNRVRMMIPVFDRAMADQGLSLA